MLFNFLLILSSALIGSTLSRIFAKILVFQKGINLFPSGGIQNIQLFNLAFAKNKSLDMIEFVLFILFTLGISGIYYFLYKKNKFTFQKKILVGSIQIVIATIFNISTLFVSSSSIETAVTILILYLLTLILSFKLPEKINTWKESKLSITNGIIAGFYLSILLHKLTPAISLPLVAFILTPIYFYIFSSKLSFLKHPAFLLLIFSFLFPYNKTLLLIIAGIIPILILFTKNKIPEKTLNFIEQISPIFILFIFLYNPTFYLGTFDPVEEGFWVGWLQRMLQGQMLYRDFAIYHPPILPTGLYLFSKLFGESIYIVRLYFHLVSITGFVLIYLILKKLVKSNWITIPLFILIMAYGSSEVRNNIEIRLASGLIPLLFAYQYNNTKQKLFLFLSGTLSALALLISVETGIASIIALLVGVILSSSRKTFISNILSTLFGYFIVLIAFFGFLLKTQSLYKFFEYTTFYPKSFSLGYQNVIMERPNLTTLIQWREINNFISSSGFLWELSKIVLGSSIAFIFVLILTKKLKPSNILFSSIAVFGLTLSRSALGRSDYYHVTFIWIVCLLLLGYLLKLSLSYSKVLPAIVLSLLIFFIGRNITQNILLQNQLIKFQSYGNISGNYPSYKNPRFGISTGIEVNTKETDNLIDYIDSNVKKNEYMFVFPHSPELYFLADRKNATSFDSPTIFFTNNYQEKIINELITNKPKVIVYDPKFGIAGISIKTLSKIDQFIQRNYIVSSKFGSNYVMTPK
jgi:hypothetical protein